MDFPYWEIAPGEFEPFVTLNLRGLQGWVGFEAYVDSGASLSVFHNERAQILGLDYKQGKKLLITVGDGGLLEVFVHTIKVEMAGQEFAAEIGFSAQLGIGFNLLGRRSFFDRFRVCFNDPKRLISFSPIISQDSTPENGA